MLARQLRRITQQTRAQLQLCKTPRNKSAGGILARNVPKWRDGSLNRRRARYQTREREYRAMRSKTAADAREML